MYMIFRKKTRMIYLLLWRDSVTDSAAFFVRKNISASLRKDDLLRKNAPVAEGCP